MLENGITVAKRKEMLLATGNIKKKVDKSFLKMMYVLYSIELSVVENGTYSVRLLLFNNVIYILPILLFYQPGIE
jgi:hypothetical protein